MSNDLIQPFASNENGLIKTPRELLIAAEKKIGELENRLRQMDEDAKLGVDTIEKMKWQNAQLRIGVTSLAVHFNQTPAQVKEIYDKYCDAQNAEVAKLSEEAKKQFMEQLKAGKVPDFKAMNREEGKVEEFKREG